MVRGEGGGEEGDGMRRISNKDPDAKTKCQKWGNRVDAQCRQARLGVNLV